MDEVIIEREATRDELIEENNELRARIDKLNSKLRDAMLDAERHTREENRLMQELRFRDGLISGLKFALKGGLNGYDQQNGGN